MFSSSQQKDIKPAKNSVMNPFAEDLTQQPISPAHPKEQTNKQWLGFVVHPSLWPLAPGNVVCKAHSLL